MRNFHPVCFVLALLVVCLYWSEAARADVDQLCIKQCVANGVTSTSCLTQCTYGEVVNPNAVPLSHRVLATPMPVGSDEIVPEKKTITPPTPDKDYTCLNACLHDGHSYEMCGEACRKPDCIEGTSQCHNPVWGVGTMGQAASHH